MHRGMIALLAALAAPLLFRCHDGGSIEASQYDQSCAVDADCVVIAIGTQEQACCGGCETAAISRQALSRYQADLASFCNGAPPCPPGPACQAPAAIPALCVDGTCRSCTQGYFCPEAGAHDAREAGPSDN